MQVFWVSGPVGRINSFSLSFRTVVLAVLLLSLSLLALGSALQFFGFRLALEYDPQIARRLGNLHTAMELESLNAVYHAPDQEKSLRNADEFRRKYQKKYLSAVECFDDDLMACVQHLRCPAKHRKHITTTNLVERSFGEENRRSKVIPRFFNEKSALKLVYATLIRSAMRWNAIKVSFDEQAQIMALRDELKHDAVKEQSIKKTRKSYALK
jgi:hypothetical protein